VSNIREAMEAAHGALARPAAVLARILAMKKASPDELAGFVAQLRSAERDILDAAKLTTEAMKLLEVIVAARTPKAAPTVAPGAWDPEALPEGVIPPRQARKRKTK